MNHAELAKLARDPSRREEFLEAIPYMKWYEGVDFRKHPEKYVIGRGEQGVLMAEPYRSEICPHWRFRTPEIAMASSEKIWELFQTYLDEGDFPGADMARKYLMMGWTRARRYANHASGKKYDAHRNIKPLEADHLTSAKAQSAQIFKLVYDQARVDPRYLALKKAHQQKQASNKESAWA